METWITELTPLSFLRRSATVYADKPAVVHGEITWTYREFAARVNVGPLRFTRRWGSRGEGTADSVGLSHSSE